MIRVRESVREEGKKKADEKSSAFFLVPRAGIEPAHPKVQDFESSASTSSATEAFIFVVGLTTHLPLQAGAKIRNYFKSTSASEKIHIYLIIFNVARSSPFTNSMK